MYKKDDDLNEKIKAQYEKEGGPERDEYHEEDTGVSLSTVFLGCTLMLGIILLVVKCSGN